MEFRNGIKYESNYARAAAYFLSTCAPAPENKPRLEAYKLITGIYKAIGDNPSVIGRKALPDVFFDPWEQQKGREKDIKAIRDPINVIEGIIKDLFDIIGSGEPSCDRITLPEAYPAIKKPLEKVLCSLGCTVLKDGGTSIVFPAESVSGLCELCAISKKHIIHITDGPKEDKAYLYFSRCVFEPEGNWTARAFDALLGADGELVRLCGELEKRGYTRVDCVDRKKISLDYVKQHGKKAEPLKLAWAERTHSGIEVSFEELRLEPCFLWIRMPMFRDVLASADKLPEDTVKFIASHTKSCDGCRYCVQTDKTGTRPLASVKFGEKKKCPLYPGFTMNWRGLSRELAENILATLDAVDKLLD